MKKNKKSYYFAQLTEHHGEYETDCTFLVSAEEKKLETALCKIMKSWRGEGKYDKEYDWWEYGDICADSPRLKEVSEKDFEVLAKYLPVL